MVLAYFNGALLVTRIGGPTAEPQAAYYVPWEWGAGHSDTMQRIAGGNEWSQRLLGWWLSMLFEELDR